MNKIVTIILVGCHFSLMIFPDCEYNWILRQIFNLSIGAAVVSIWTFWDTRDELIKEWLNPLNIHEEKSHTPLTQEYWERYIKLFMKANGWKFDRDDEFFLGFSIKDHKGKYFCRDYCKLTRRSLQVAIENRIPNDPI